MNGRVIITGASRGLGEAIAHQIVEKHGLQPVMAYWPGLDEESVKAMGKQFGAENVSPLDVVSKRSWEEFTSRLVESDVPVRGVVANAGVTCRKGILDTPEDEWDNVLEVNLKGVFLTFKHMVPHVAAGGSMVAISSFAGQSGYFAAAYTASKWGVRGLSRTAAVEFGPKGVRVNTVCPGFFESPLTSGVSPLMDSYAQQTAFGRLPVAAEIASAVAYLIGDESRFVTGTDILVDGGLMAGSYMRGWER